MPAIARLIGRFSGNFHKISQYQFEYFSPMIPHFLSEQWGQALNDQTFSLKLCGGGGGGFFLGFTQNFERAKSILSDFNCMTLYRF